MANIFTNAFSDFFTYFGAKRFFDNKVALPSNREILGSKSVMRLDVNDNLEVTKQVSELALVILRKAGFFSTGIWKHYDKDGVEIENSIFVERFNKPNFYQGGTDFVREISISMSVFGNAIIKFDKSTKSHFTDAPPTNLSVLPFNDLEVNLTGKRYYEVENLSDVISSIVDTGIQPNKVFSTDEVLILRDNTSENKAGNVMSVSRIEALRMPLSNTKVAYEARNVGIQEKGALAIISAEAQNGIAAYNPTEKDDLEKDLTTNYGVHKGQKRYKYSNTPIKVHSLAYDLSKLGLLDEVEVNFRRTVDTFGLKMDLFSDEKGSKYENLKDAEITTYTSTIIPEAAIISEALTKAFAPEGTRFMLDFSHLAILQEDGKVKTDADKAQIDLLNKALGDKVISIQEYRDNLPDFMELDDSLDFGEDSSDIDKLLFESSLKLRGTVGGVDGIIGINESVANGQMSRQNAINLLVTIYQFDEVTANSLITDITNNGENQAGENNNTRAED